MLKVVTPAVVWRVGRDPIVIQVRRSHAPSYEDDPIMIETFLLFYKPY